MRKQITLSETAFSQLAYMVKRESVKRGRKVHYNEMFEILDKLHNEVKNGNPKPKTIDEA